MFDEKEIEELCDEFLSLDGNVFLESVEDITKLEGEVISSDFNINLFKKLPNLKNNNFIGDTSGVYLDKPNASTHLDLINENSITLNTFEGFKNAENAAIVSDLGRSVEKPVRSQLVLDKKEDEIDNEYKDVDEKLTSPDALGGKNCFHRGGWAPDSLGLWRSGPSSLNVDRSCNNSSPHQELTSSVTYSSNEPQSLNTFLSSSKRIYSHQQLGAKVEMVYSLLSMLDMNNREDMSKTFLAMSSSAESCHAMRQSGCIPLLIQLIHSSELNKEVRERAAEALRNIVHSQTDEKRREREVRVLKLLQQVRGYCDELKSNCAQELLQLQESEKHPINAIGTLMKFSFDAEHRQAICILGGLHAISELIQVDYEAHGNTTAETPCITLRRYAVMSLTNLTFGDCKNKALLCSFSKFMCALVDQLKSPCEDLRQVTASVLRNLSWRADSDSKQALREVGAVTALTISAMEGKKESTLKSVLSALWNLSAHCSLNKIDICSIPGALAFLVRTMRYKSSSNTLPIVENAGGILRNISSHVAVREDYRQILRENNCFEVLLEQLKSPSLTIVSNACGTLWNLSARCPEDQRRLWEMGATTMLRSLVQSKHKVISMASSAALKNLLAANPNENLLTHLDSTAKSLGLQNLPTLFVRKKRALEQELNITLAETCENIDSIESPTHFNIKTDVKKGNGPRRSESRDSVQSTHSDSAYERINQITHKSEEKLLDNKNITLHDSLDEKSTPRKLEDQKLIRRYKSSMIPTATFKKVNQDRINERTKETSAAETNTNELTDKTDIKADADADTKERSKNGNQGLSAIPRSIKGRSYDASNEGCSSLNYSQTYEESSVKCRENLEAENGDNVDKCHTAKAVLNSPYEESMSSDLNREEVPESRRECERVGKDVEEFESLRNSGDRASDTYPPTALNIGMNNRNSVETIRASSLHTPEVFDKDLNENASEREITEYGLYESELSSNGPLNFSEGQYKTIQRNKNNGNTIHSASDVSEKLTEKFQDQNSQKQLSLKVDFSPRDSASDDQDIQMQPTTSKSVLHRDPSEVGPKEFIPNESKEIVKENESNFLSPKQPPRKGQDESTEILHRSTTIPVQENRYEIHGEASHTLLAGFPNLPHESFSQPVSQSASQDRDARNQKKSRGVLTSSRTETGHRISACNSFTDSKRMIILAGLSEPKQTEINFPPDSSEDTSESTCNERTESETISVEKADDVAVKALSSTVLPKFKVGSPITDSKVLQMEANKICREIKKHQDFEMGCSLTSEVSLVSCSSFIDTGDYSLFDCSSDAVDFDDSENLDFSKVSSRFKSLPLRKLTTSQTADAVSLPSLGSLKNEQIEALDLDTSILSVASITSEIAETYSKDLEACNTYTKTYKVGARNECLDTVADATLVSNGDDTLNADSLQNNPELFDDDNSLHSQENLPLDTDEVEESTLIRMKKKLTPKEKRKVFFDRYRTYTIRDISGCKTAEVASAVGCQDLKKNDVSVSCEQQSDQYHRNDDDFDHRNFVRKDDDKEVYDVTQKFQSNFYFGNEDETLLFPKKCTEMKDFIPGFGVDSKSLNELMNIGPAERKELVDNAKLVAFSLKTAVHDPEVISDSEAEDPPAEIDTATYNKSFREHYLDAVSPQEFQRLEYYEEPFEEGDLEKKGARISKPNEKSEGKVEEVPKGIRGRRKPLYSPPQKHSQRTSGSPSNLPKMSQTVPEKKKSSEPSVPPTLNREGTFTKEDGFALKKNEFKNVRTIPVLHRNYDSKDVTSSRPVSRNKSGAVAGNPRRFGENQTSKIGRPVSTYASKTNERRSQSDSSQRRSFSAEAGNKIGGDGATATRKPTLTGLMSPRLRSSSSNQNVKVGNSPGSSGYVRSKNSSLQSLKSQSDANLNLVASKDRVSVRKQKTPKKEVTSKIASLWRKVEETKQKNRASKDNRVWISSEKNTKPDEILVVEQEEILDIPTRKIVHSLTCQALSDEASPEFTSQEGNRRNVREYMKLGVSEEKREKTERRNIISAIVPPYNYNPPVSEKTTPLKIDQVDTFHKGSLKITTV